MLCPESRPQLHSQNHTRARLHTFLRACNALHRKACKEQGRVGALLRREGLYSSNLITWRRQAERGTLEALSPKKRGPKEKKPDPSLRRITELEKITQRLEHKLRQAELIIAAQKKIAEIFQMHLDPKEETNS